MTMEYKLKANCNNCICFHSCKYIAKHKELVNSNEFYGMFEYLEWNNLHEQFKKGAWDYGCYRPMVREELFDSEKHLQFTSDMCWKYCEANNIEVYSLISPGTKTMKICLKDKTEIPIQDLNGKITIKLVKGL